MALAGALVKDGLWHDGLTKPRLQASVRRRFRLSNGGNDSKLGQTGAPNEGMQLTRGAWSWGIRPCRLGCAGSVREG